MKKIILFIAFAAISFTVMAAGNSKEPSKNKGKTSFITMKQIAKTIVFKPALHFIYLTAPCPDGSVINAGTIVILYDDQSGEVKAIRFVPSGNKCDEYIMN